MDPYFFLCGMILTWKGFSAWSTREWSDVLSSRLIAIPMAIQDASWRGFVDVVSQCIRQKRRQGTHGGFPKSWGYPQSSSSYRWDFPEEKKPSSSWLLGSPMTMETPTSCKVVSSIVLLLMINHPTNVVSSAQLWRFFGKGCGLGPGKSEVYNLLQPWWTGRWWCPDTRGGAKQPRPIQVLRMTKTLQPGTLVLFCTQQMNIQNCHTFEVMIQITHHMHRQLRCVTPISMMFYLYNFIHTGARIQLTTIYI